MNRTDISPYLIHFTKDTSTDLAFQRLQKILEDGFLIGGSEFIKGKYKCVCFSETPETQIEKGLVNPRNYSRYSPFGILVSKKWLFSQGGRPVIYQPEEEYEYLSEIIVGDMCDMT